MKTFAMMAAAFLLSATAANAKTTEYPYGKDPLQRIDVTPLRGRHHPILIMVHGGAWITGDKTDTTVSEPKRSYFAEPEHGGFMFVSVNYRLTPMADAYTQAQDVADAVKYVKEHADEWGGDADRIVLMGHSAGGHLVNLLGANPAKFGLTPWRATVVLDSAAYDVPSIMKGDHFEYYNPAFGDDSEEWNEGSPLAQLQANATPFFLVCSTQGPFPCSKAHEFAGKAQGLGVPATVREEDKEHIEINDAVGEPGQLTNAIANFIATYVQ